MGLEEAEKNAAADKIKRENIDLKNQADLLCSEVEKELATSTLAEDEQQEINKLIGEIKQTIQDDNIDSLKLLIEDLKEKKKKKKKTLGFNPSLKKKKKKKKKK